MLPPMACRGVTSTLKHKEDHFMHMSVMIGIGFVKAARLDALV